jgi:hypothetical protein
VRSGKGGHRREIGMDAWVFEQLRPRLKFRLELPVGPLFCVIDGPTAGHAWGAAGVRVEFRRLAQAAGVRRRFAPHQLRHTHAIELAREHVPLNIIQRQLGHANLGTTSILGVMLSSGRRAGLRRSWRTRTSPCSAAKPSASTERQTVWRARCQSPCLDPIELSERAPTVADRGRLDGSCHQRSERHPRCRRRWRCHILHPAR